MDSPGLEAPAEEATELAPSSAMAWRAARAARARLAISLPTSRLSLPPPSPSSLPPSSSLENPFMESCDMSREVSLDPCLDPCLEVSLDTFREASLEASLDMSREGFLETSLEAFREGFREVFRESLGGCWGFRSGQDWFRRDGWGGMPGGVPPGAWRCASPCDGGLEARDEPLLELSPPSPTTRILVTSPREA